MVSGISGVGGSSQNLPPNEQILALQQSLGELGAFGNVGNLFNQVHDQIISLEKNPAFKKYLVPLQKLDSLFREYSEIANYPSNERLLGDMMSQPPGNPIAQRAQNQYDEVNQFTDKLAPLAKEL